MAKKARKKPRLANAGRRWRILAHGKEPVELYSPEAAASAAAYSKEHKLPVRERPIALPSVFDELVIDDWLHLEQMDTDSWWLRLGDACINISIGANGRVHLSIERGAY